MERIQERKLSMYLVVMTGLERTDAEVSGLIPKFGFYRDALGSAIVDIGEFSKIQVRNIKGTAAQKLRCRTALVAACLEVLRRIRAYAVDEGDVELEALVDYPSWHLEQVADTILIDGCRVVYRAGLERTGLLVDYGVSVVLLERLEGAIVAFEEMIPKPRLKIVTKKDATAALKRLFGETDVLLQKMDKVFEMIRGEHPGFYRNYRSNRLLTGGGYRKVAVLGKVKDADGAVLGRVEVSVIGTEVAVFSGPSGQYRIKKLPAGVYEAVFEKEGFARVVVKIEVVKGVQSRVDVVMGLNDC